MDVTPEVPGVEVVENPLFVARVAECIFKGVWDLLLNTQFPGLKVPIAAVVIGLLLIRLSLKIFGYLTGFGMSGGDYGRAANMAEKAKNEYSRRKMREE